MNRVTSRVLCASAICSLACLICPTEVVGADLVQTGQITIDPPVGPVTLTLQGPASGQSAYGLTLTYISESGAGAGVLRIHDPAGKFQWQFTDALEQDRLAMELIDNHTLRLVSGGNSIVLQPSGDQPGITVNGQRLATLQDTAGFYSAGANPIFNEIRSTGQIFLNGPSANGVHFMSTNGGLGSWIGQFGEDSSLYLQNQANGFYWGALTSSGRWGVGTTNPQAKLDVVDSTSVTTQNYGAVNVGLEFNPADHSYQHFASASGAVTYVTGNKNVLGYIGIRSTASTVFHLSSGYIAQSAASYLTTFNLGAGNIGQAFGLYVDYPKVGGTGRIVNSYGLYVAPQKVNGVDSGYGVYSEGAADKNVFMGSVGVGTASPLTSLQVDGNIGLYSSNGTSVGSPVGASLYLGDGNYVNEYYYNSAPGLSAVFDPDRGNAAALAFYTYNNAPNARVERVRITSTGNIGVGTATPSAKFHVIGNARFDGAMRIERQGDILMGEFGN